MAKIKNPVKVSYGKALKRENTTSFEETLDTYNNSGNFPFLENKKFDILYFTSPNSDSSSTGSRNKETERFIKTHTQLYEKISKPQNQWVLFTQLNARLIDILFEIEERKTVKIYDVTPILKEVWKVLNNQTMQYYTYLSTLDNNLHRVIHPNYQVQHSPIRQSDISSDLLASNLLINTHHTETNTASNANLFNLLKKSKKNVYKLSSYSYLSITERSIVATRGNVEKMVMSQPNKYTGLKTLKYCNRIKFIGKPANKKQNKVVKPSKN